MVVVAVAVGGEVPVWSPASVEGFGIAGRVGWLEAARVVDGWVGRVMEVVLGIAEITSWSLSSDSLGRGRRP